jgi:phage regulator Rha-like protein
VFDMTELVKAGFVESRIYAIRGQKVLLDRDLAFLYGVRTKELNQAVKRNRKRFPADFMFRLAPQEHDSLRFRFGTLKRGQHSKYFPYAFTELGVAMLSSVLNSERAIQVNIAIMRAFVRMREVLADNKELAKRLEAAERRLGRLRGSRPRLCSARRSRRG